MAVNVQAAVEVQLLGVNLVGMLSKTSATVDQKTQDTMEFLIMPSSLDENTPIDVDTVTQEINNTIYKIENNTSVLPEGGAQGPVDAQTVKNAMDIVGMGNAKLTFMQTFIHYKKVSEDDTQKSKITEYAIGVHIQGTPSESPEEFKFLQIKEVYINVWDTTNQKVLERMKIWTPEQLQIS